MHNSGLQGGAKRRFVLLKSSIVLYGISHVRRTMMLSRAVCCQTRLIGFATGSASRGVTLGVRTAARSSRNHHDYGQQCQLLLRWNNPPILPRIRHLSSSTTAVSNASKATTPTNIKTWTIRWRRFAKVVKYIRIPAIMVSVYALGYQQGIIECSRSPRLMEGKPL